MARGSIRPRDFDTGRINLESKEPTVTPTEVVANDGTLIVEHDTGVVTLTVLGPRGAHLATVEILPTAAVAVADALAEHAVAAAQEESVEEDAEKDDGES